MYITDRISSTFTSESLAWFISLTKPSTSVLLNFSSLVKFMRKKISLSLPKTRAGIQYTAKTVPWNLSKFLWERGQLLSTVSPKVIIPDSFINLKKIKIKKEINKCENAKTTAALILDKSSDLAKKTLNSLSLSWNLCPKIFYIIVSPIVYE